MPRAEIRIRGLSRDHLERHEDQDSPRQRPTRLSPTAIAVSLVAVVAVTSALIPNPVIPVKGDEISITSVYGAGTDDRPILNIAGTVKDATISEVRLFVNGSAQTAPVTNQNFNAQFPLPEGRYEIQASTGKFASPAIHGVGQGAIDLVVVFDTTSSMASYIEAMKTSTADLIRRLRDTTRDLRVGLVNFRDYQADAATAVLASPLSDDVNGQLEKIKAWEAGGGGPDDPEDQLAGIKAALKMAWRNQGRHGEKMTKLIVLVTDADAKDPTANPDTITDTTETIAKMARDLDPVRVYPIIVSDDAAALAHGEKIANLTGGKMVRSADPKELGDLFSSAVETSFVETSAAAERPWLSKSERYKLIILLVALGLGSLGLFIATRFTKPLLAE